MSEMMPEVSMADTLRHIADDHPCCGPSLLAAATLIEALDATARAERSHSMSVEDDLLTVQARVKALERESDGLVDAYNAKSQRCAELEVALAAHRPDVLSGKEEPVCDCVPGHVCDLHAEGRKP